MATIFEKANQILEEKQLKLKPENLKKGITLFGIEGTLESNPTKEPILEELTAIQNGEYLPDDDKDGFNKVIVNVPVEGTDTSDANATINDLPQGKTAYVKGEKIEGILYDCRAGQGYSVDLGYDNNRNIDMESQPNQVMIPYFFYSDGAVIDRSTPDVYGMVDYDALAEAIGLTANKLKAGETILGIAGTFEGEAGSGDLSDADLQELLNLAYQIQGTQDYTADKIVLTLDEYNELIAIAKDIKGINNDVAIENLIHYYTNEVENNELIDTIGGNNLILYNNPISNEDYIEFDKSCYAKSNESIILDDYTFQYDVEIVEYSPNAYILSCGPYPRAGLAYGDTSDKLRLLGYGASSVIASYPTLTRTLITITRENNQVKVYFDNELKLTLQDIGSTINYCLSINKELTIDNNFYEGINTSGAHLKIYSLKIYNKALTEEEIYKTLNN